MIFVFSVECWILCKRGDFKYFMDCLFEIMYDYMISSIASHGFVLKMILVLFHLINLNLILGGWIYCNCHRSISSGLVFHCLANKWTDHQILSPESYSHAERWFFNFSNYSSNYIWIVVLMVKMHINFLIYLSFSSIILSLYRERSNFFSWRKLAAGIF